jgi:hypothetical protein
VRSVGPSLPSETARIVGIGGLSWGLAPSTA